MRFRLSDAVIRKSGLVLGPILLEFRWLVLTKRTRRPTGPVWVDLTDSLFSCDPAGAGGSGETAMLLCDSFERFSSPLECGCDQ